MQPFSPSLIVPLLLVLHVTPHLHNKSTAHAGTKPIARYVKVDKHGQATYSNAGEKLHQKRHWRLHRMLLDFWPHFDDQPQMRQVPPSLLLCCPCMPKIG